MNDLYCRFCRPNHYANRYNIHFQGANLVSLTTTGCCIDMMHNYMWTVDCQGGYKLGLCRLAALDQGRRCHIILKLNSAFIFQLSVLPENNLQNTTMLDEHKS